MVYLHTILCLTVFPTATITNYQITTENYGTKNATAQAQNAG